MRFIRDKKFLALATAVTMSLASCTTSSEDDNRLEVEDPVEAATMSEDGDLGDPSTAPEGKPAESIAIPSAQPATSGTVSSAPAEAQPAAPVSGGAIRRVMYVKFDGVALREQADSKAKKLGTLNKGDHLLVTIEGEWARTDDGKYIKAKSLSEKGVGRSKRDASWSGGSGPAESAPVAAPTASKNSEDKKISRKLPAKTKAGDKADGSKSESGSEAAPADTAVDSQP